MVEKLFSKLEELYPQMVEIRRDLHMNPELSFQEVRTPKMIVEYLKNIGIEVKTNVGGNGVVGYLRGGKPGKTVALRADFDALPIDDEKEVEYKSKIPGVMHACGHDIHTAALLAVANVLSEHREEIPGTIVFIHQFAEEVAPGGAKSMIEDGCLNDVDVIYGCHCDIEFPIGEIAINEGLVHSASDAFEITVHGKGGHGATPHQTVDSVVVGSQLVVDLQQIVSRRIDPMKPTVLTVGSFHSGEAPNVIADQAKIRGTVRTYEEGIRDQVEDTIRIICEKNGEKNDATIDVKYNRGYPPLDNYPEEVHRVEKLTRSLLGEDKLKKKPPELGAEDFAYYLKEIPGTFIWVGGRNPSIQATYPHHHPKFDIDERCMINIGKIFISAIMDYNGK